MEFTKPTSETYPRKIKVRTVSDEQRENIKGWLQVVINLLVVIGSALAGWSFNQTLTLRSDMDAIKASRFSAQDGLELWKEVANIKQSMAALPNKTEIQQLDERQRLILERLTRIEAAITNGTKNN